MEREELADQLLRAIKLVSHDAVRSVVIRANGAKITIEKEQGSHGTKIEA